MTQAFNLNSSKFQKDPIEDLDQTVLSILIDLKNYTLDNAQQSVDNILNISSGYLTDQVKTALQEFNDLYFGKLKQEGITDDINKDIDKMIDGIHEALEMGEDPYEHESIMEDEILRKRRLGIAAIQKKLESIVSFDEGIKKQLFPVLWNMQFEELIRHRLNNLIVMWQIVANLYAQKKVLDVDDLTSWLSTVPSSEKEKELFYKIVLGQEPPAGLESQDSMFDIFSLD